MASPTQLSLRAFAKLNLALAVAPPQREGPRRGWHRICSWMHTIELHDDVLVEIDRGLDGPMLDVRWADDAPMHAGERVAWPLEQDLALRAARLLDPHAPLRITVRKRIPDGGGLGGGSSNAAAVLRAADALLGLGLGPQRLRERAMELGSDIAFFIDDVEPALDAPPRPAIVSDFGETIERLAAPTEPEPVTLVIPPFGCATGEVYRLYDGYQPSPMREAEVRAAAKQPIKTARLFNDLGGPAQATNRDLEELLFSLEHDWPVEIHVTGSGSTLFAIGHHTELIDAHTDDCRLVLTHLV